jgi:isoamylase
MRVDGFRFDLAASLARQFHEVDRLSAFFDLVQQDPVVSQVKLIAEPWDVGPGGYQVGNFPPRWTEWNGKYRDTVRDYWRGQPGSLGEFAERLSGSSDLYESDGRAPYASINFVTAHDGFTLRDLTSYNEKRNEANGENNNDGESHNRSWNCGAEGETNDREVLALRARQARNFLTTLLLSQGVPMILHGDEIGRTQRGNNNTYCQDNELSWIDWHGVDRRLLAFTQRLTKLRASHPVFRRRRFFTGEQATNGLPDIAWLNSDGDPMDGNDWSSGTIRPLVVFLNGEAITEPGLRGQDIRDDSFLLLFNPGHEDIELPLPDGPFGKRWQPLVDTSNDTVSEDRSRALRAGTKRKVVARSVVVLRRV